jgi:hypothetical protein
MARVLCSDGKATARAYVLMGAPLSVPAPSAPAERVLCVDPLRTPTVRRDERPASGPRNPDQRAWPAPEAPAVELPDRRPATKTQRVILDPDLVARWRADARAKREGA